jgi:hypothetical protein
MTLGATQPLRETSTRHLPGGKDRPERKADNLADCLKKCGSLDVSQRYGPSEPVKRMALRPLYRLISARDCLNV